MPGSISLRGCRLEGVMFCVLLELHQEVLTFLHKSLEHYQQLLSGQLVCTLFCKRAANCSRGILQAELPQF